MSSVNNEKIEKNTVPANDQVKAYDIVRTVDQGGMLNILFLGNSITRHAPSEELGWFGDWGMAASSEEKDYVHVTVKKLEEKIGKINYCTACCGDWEREYFNDNNIPRWKEAREFGADVIIVRLGENIWGKLRENLDSVPLYPHLEKFISYFTVKKPVKVIITDLFWSFDGIDKVIKEIADKKGYFFVHIGDLGENNEMMAIGQFAHEGVSLHPNDNGMREISNRIYEKIFG